MSGVRKHYDEHLAPIYGWMAGPFDEACAPSTQLFAELDLHPLTTGIAVDLGCGHGLQTLPLARLGYRVAAIDLCTGLLAELDAHVGAFPIEAINADIMHFEDHVPQQVDLVVCMGDTLTHLASLDDVRELIGRISRVLTKGGCFVTTFRDYVSQPLRDDARFIPVRSDDQRVLTCFLEYMENTVRVHDIVNARGVSGWILSVSSYEKLRIDPSWPADVARQYGMRVVLERTDMDVTTMVATSPAD